MLQATICIWPEFAFHWNLHFIRKLQRKFCSVNRPEVKFQVLCACDSMCPSASATCLVPEAERNFFYEWDFSAAAAALARYSCHANNYVKGVAQHSPSVNLIIGRQLKPICIGGAPATVPRGCKRNNQIVPPRYYTYTYVHLGEIFERRRPRQTRNKATPIEHVLWLVLCARLQFYCRLHITSDWVSMCDPIATPCPLRNAINLRLNAYRRLTLIRLLRVIGKTRVRVYW
jgi:hypothetical protein